MSSEWAIRVSHLSKTYRLYDRPRDRGKQWIIPPLQKCLGRSPSQYYRDVHAIDDVSFEVLKGETLGIIGRNGSGKSTLLQLIVGILSPTSGTIETNGRIAALLELGAGFHPEFTGRENVFLNATLLGLSRGELETQLDEILRFAEIGAAIDQPLKTYSSGMVVRLAFSVIAHVKADILIIDEALAVGDAFFVQKCMRFLRTFRERGTVLFVSHDSAAILNFCHRALWLEKGHIQVAGSAKLAVERYLASTHQADIVSIHDEGEHPVGALKQTKVPPRDMRLDLINQSNLRNDIEVFSFKGDARGFGTGGARIVSASLFDQAAGQELSWVIGGEPVCVVIEFVASVSIRRAVVGFFIKDRLGQILFGENTHLATNASSISIDAGEKAVAYFSFHMPILPQGIYSADVAVADGTPSDNRQLQWLHDAFKLESRASSTSTGLVGIPFEKIELRKLCWAEHVQAS
ncbi:MAG: ABC transporter ATP-binding protein [Nitrospira sp.]|nr:ABC transporter ATP-binding protein [Nitrospira sp.]MBS0178215.1 ABC transporter ATP-binding protein [Nitrospira sp.]